MTGLESHAICSRDKKRKPKAVKVVAVSGRCRRAYTKFEAESVGYYSRSTAAEHLPPARLTRCG